MSDGTRSDGDPEHQVREGQRIAKVMARAGLCSRREAEAWIEAGRVSVNGETLTSPAYNVSDADEVRVDGKPLAPRERTRLFLFHKPRGLVTTARDPEGRATIFDALPPELPRMIAVGRLDINTEGLLLLTNDGGLARVLELPSTGWLRRYRVRAHGSVEQATLDGLRMGVTVDGVDYAGIDAKFDREQGSNAWITMGLREGKNREIRRVLEHLGLTVNRLIRVSFGPFELGDLREGEVIEIRTRVLKDQLGAKLAREAGADFEAPIAAREATPLPAEERPATRGKSFPIRERGRRGFADAPPRGKRFDRDEPTRREPPRPSTPERRRKHVSALRAEITSDATDSSAPRKRTERGATQDRKGRTIAVERISHAREARRPHRAEGREPLERGRLPNPSGFKAPRDGGGKSREGGHQDERGFEARPARKGPPHGRPERRDEGERPRRTGDAKPSRPKPPRDELREDPSFVPRARRPGKRSRPEDGFGGKPRRESLSGAHGPRAGGPDRPGGRPPGRGPGKPPGKGGPRRPPRKS